MNTLKPVFKLHLGSFLSETDHAAGGPVAVRVERDMDVAADAAEARLMERPDAAVGDAVEIDLGHDGQTERVFTGELVELAPTLSGARLRALGAMNKLLNHRQSATYEDQSAGSIVNDLVGAAGLDIGEVSDGPELPVFAVDRRCSAWAHVKSLADRLGYELYCDREGKLQFRAHGSAADLDSAGGLSALAGAAASALGVGAAGEGYAFRKHLLRLEAARRAPALGGVTVGGESPSSTEGDATAHWLTRNDADFRGSAGNGGPESLYGDGAARTKDLADRFAAGLLSRANRHAREITFRILGRPSLDLGQGLQVSDVPDALGNGSGYVRALRHRFDSEAGFITEVRLALEVQS